MYVTRDPFARTELHRTTVQRSKGCDWCGNGRQTNGVYRLYAYHTETDGGTTHPHKGAFCTRTCHDDYHS